MCLQALMQHKDNYRLYVVLSKLFTLASMLASFHPTVCQRAGPKPSAPRTQTGTYHFTSTTRVPRCLLIALRKSRVTLHQRKVHGWCPHAWRCSCSLQALPASNGRPRKQSSWCSKLLWLSIVPSVLLAWPFPPPDVLQWQVR